MCQLTVHTATAAAATALPWQQLLTNEVDSWNPNIGDTQPVESSERLDLI